MFVFPFFEAIFKTFPLIVVDWKYKIDKQIDTKYVNFDAITTRNCCYYCDLPQLTVYLVINKKIMKIGKSALNTVS